MIFFLLAQNFSTFFSLHLLRQISRKLKLSYNDKSSGIESRAKINLSFFSLTLKANIKYLTMALKLFLIVAKLFFWFFTVAKWLNYFNPLAGVCWYHFNVNFSFLNFLFVVVVLDFNFNLKRKWASSAAQFAKKSLINSNFFLFFYCYHENARDFAKTNFCNLFDFWFKSFFCDYFCVSFAYREELE